ncbi:MAG: hypothetical protein PHV20_12690 [Bacteroidales bacterium]|nr:hypothetical protein [Bacteroidales bacterium]
MKKILLPLLALTLMVVSCGKSSGVYKDLASQNDSLKLTHEKTVQEFDNALALINEVQDGLAKMKDAENYLKVEASQGKELTPTTREQIASDMATIAETLQKNKAELAKLKANTKAQSTQLKATIERLMGELDAKTKLVADLQAQLLDKDVKIGELVAKTESLSGEVSNLSAESQKQKDELAAQDKSLNTAWYVFGTKAELKKQSVITGGGLFKSADVLKKDFNKEYFIAIDVRNTKSIELFSKKAKFLTTHPVGSYSLEKDNAGMLTLKISDYKSFWSISRYLVIQVD